MSEVHYGLQDNRINLDFRKLTNHPDKWPTEESKLLDVLADLEFILAQGNI